jgi:Protein of unknown function (DUF2752)
MSNSAHPGRPPRQILPGTQLRLGAGSAIIPPFSTMTQQKSHTTALWAALIAAALLFAFEPATTWWFPSCPFYALTGWLCPLCGSLRAVHAVLHGAPRVAFGLNPLTTIGMAAALLAGAYDAGHPACTTRQLNRLFGLYCSPPALALAFLFGVIRNASLDWLVR